MLKPVLAVAAGLIVVLGVPTFLAHKGLSDKKSEKAKVEQHNTKLQADINSKADIQAAAAEVDSLDAEIATLLKNDVSWSHEIQEISKTMPAGTWLDTFQGTVTAPAPVAPPTPAPAEGDSSSSDSSNSDAATPPAAESHRCRPACRARSRSR